MIRKICSVMMCLSILVSTACVSEVRPVTSLSVKSDTKLNSVLIFTQTGNKILDPGGLFHQDYYRTMLDRLKGNLIQSGVNVDELQLKIDELSLDPKGDALKAIKAKNPENILYVDVARLTKNPSAYSISFEVKIVLMNNITHRKLYESSFLVDQTIDFGTESKMNELGDKIFAELKAPIGIAHQDNKEKGVSESVTPVAVSSNDEVKLVASEKCLGIAREMADKKKMIPSEIRAVSKELLDTCPGVAYECVTYVRKPEDNKCTGVPLTLNGGILKNRIYN